MIANEPAAIGGTVGRAASLGAFNGNVAGMVREGGCGIGGSSPRSKSDAGFPNHHAATPIVAMIRSAAAIASDRLLDAGALSVVAFSPLILFFGTSSPSCPAAA